MGEIYYCTDTDPSDHLLIFPIEIEKLMRTRIQCSRLVRVAAPSDPAAGACTSTILTQPEPESMVAWCIVLSERLHVRKEPSSDAPSLGVPLPSPAQTICMSIISS